MNENYEIKLAYFSENYNDSYKINEFINIEDEIKKIMSWNYSDESFLRGIIYEVYEFNIYSEKKTINLRMKKHDSNKALELSFYIDNVMIGFNKTIQCLDIINRIDEKIIK
jgi:hypothetical protein